MLVVPPFCLFMYAAGRGGQQIFTCCPAGYIAFIWSHVTTNQPITFGVHPCYRLLHNNVYCYVANIGQNRVTCRSTKRHVWQPVRNETFIDLSIIKWVQYACVSTMKFQSSFFKLFTKHLRRPFIQFWFQIKFTPITGELFILEWYRVY
jgi:hypothetical protein